MISQPVESGSVTKIGGRGQGPGGQLTGLALPVGHCPVSGCSEEIDPSHLMCRRHWHQVPKQLRDRVWATWRSGQSATSHEHRAAVPMDIAARPEQRSAGKPTAA
jgi:hypothetical protein